MGANVEAMEFTDLREETVGLNFYNDKDWQTFAATAIGEATIASVTEQMAEQGYDNPTDSTIRRAIASEQSNQDYGYRTAELTNEQLLDSNAPGWIEALGQQIGEWKDAIVGGVEDAAYEGGEAVVDHVTTEGMSGEAAEALKNRTDVIDNAVDGMSGGSSFKP